MKKCEKTVFGLVLAIVLLFVSCENSNNLNKQDVAQQLFEENPVTITWTGSNKTDIESCQQDVSIYSYNNRTSEGVVLANKYRLSLKTIDGKLHTRLDFPADSFTRARSCVSDGNEVVIFDPETDEIQYRASVMNDEEADLFFLSNQSVNNRVNLEFIVSEARRLSFDITEDSSNELILELPSNYFNKSTGEQRIRTKAVFDIENEILSNTEIVNVLEDGTEVSTITNMIYEEKNGEYIKIGSITVIDSKNPNVIEGVENVEEFDSIDDIPELSSEQLQLMQDQGLASETGPITFGNIGDLSYTETIIEVFSDIKINQIENSMFRILNGGM